MKAWELTLNKWVKAFGENRIDEIANMLSESNALLEELMKNEPPAKPLTWWQRKRVDLGNWVVRLGTKIGSDYDYY